MVFIDVLQGMLIGVVASLLFAVYQSNWPHVASLGHVPGLPGYYSDLTRHPENIPVPGVMIVRLDGQLYYANAQTFRARVKAMIEAMEPAPRVVILDASAQDQIDVTGSDILQSLLKELRGKGIDVYAAEVHAPVLEYSRKTNLIQSIGDDHVFPTVDLAVRSIGHVATWVKKRKVKGR